MAAPQVTFDQDDSTTTSPASQSKPTSVKFDQAGKAPTTVNFDAPNDKEITTAGTGSHPDSYGFTGHNILKNIADVGQSLIKMPGQVYHAFSDEPTESEKSEGAEWRKLNPVGPITNLLAPTETSGTKRVGLGLERLIRPGYEREQQRANEEQNTPTTNNTDLAGHALMSGVHRAASVVPFVGPIAGEVTDQAVSGDIGGALTKAATLYVTGKLMEAAPDVAKSVSKGVKIDLPGGGEGGIKIPGISKVGEIANTVSNVSAAADFLASKGKSIAQDVQESTIGTRGYNLAYKTLNYALENEGKPTLNESEFKQLYNHLAYDEAFPELNRRATPRVAEKLTPEQEKASKSPIELSPEQQAAQASRMPKNQTEPAQAPAEGVPESSRMRPFGPAQAEPSISTPRENIKQQFAQGGKINPSAEPAAGPSLDRLEEALNKSTGAGKPAPGVRIGKGETVPIETKAQRTQFEAVHGPEVHQAISREFPEQADNIQKQVHAIPNEPKLGDVARNQEVIKGTDTVGRAKQSGAISRPEVFKRLLDKLGSAANVLKELGIRTEGSAGKPGSVGKPLPTRSILPKNLQSDFDETIKRGEAEKHISKLTPAEIFPIEKSEGVWNITELPEEWDSYDLNNVFHDAQNEANRTRKAITLSRQGKVLSTFEPGATLTGPAQGKPQGYKEPVRPSGKAEQSSSIVPSRRKVALDRLAKAQAALRLRNKSKK